MKKLVIGVASLTLVSAIVANASILSLGPAVYDNPAGPPVGGLPSGPWSLEIPFVIDISSPGTTMPYSGANWSVSLTDGVLGAFHSVVVEGVHLVAPHPGEVAPGPIAFLGLLFPGTAGSGGDAFGVVPHHVPGPGGGDDWLLTAHVTVPGTTVEGTIYAWHVSAVPEPSTLGALAGVCLIGLAALRRGRA